MVRSIRLLSVLLVAVMAVLAGPLTASAEVVCPAGPTIEGIDVSHWQGTINWDQVATDNVEFALIRVSHGTGTLDTEFDRNWPEAQRVGLTRGVYQFFSAASDPIAQADLLINKIGGELGPNDLPPVLDVEGLSLDGPSNTVAAANMRAWVNHVETELGVTPIIYTAKYFWRDSLGNPDFSSHPLWVAHYGVNCPDLPPRWTNWLFWQYTSMGSVNGISGNVDRNHFNGTVQDLQDLVSREAICGDMVCSEGETPQDCPADCCAPVPPSGRTVDETDACFIAGGNPSYWREEMAGYDGSLIWTHTTDSADVDNHGIWTLTFEQAGTYRLEVYTDAGWAQSTQAGYIVRHGGQEETFVVDQSVNDGWTTVAEVEFAGGGDQWVRLNDNTGEPYADRVQIVFDAVRLTRLDAPMEDMGADVADNADMAADISPDMGEDMGADVADPAPDGMLADTSGPADGASDTVLDGTQTQTANAGCGCTISHQPAPDTRLAVVMVLFLLMTWMRARRTRASRA